MQQSVELRINIFSTETGLFWNEIRHNPVKVNIVSENVLQPSVGSVFQTLHDREDEDCGDQTQSDKYTPQYPERKTAPKVAYD